MRTKQSKREMLKHKLSEFEWLGVIVTWSTGYEKIHKYEDVLAALQQCELDVSLASEFLPRHAFTRAAKHLSEDRIIDIVCEDQDKIKFQFTAKYMSEMQWHFSLECFIYLDKRNGTITSDNRLVEEEARKWFDFAMKNRTNSDITRIVQKLFEQNADLIPLRNAGGVYFVPHEHIEFVSRVAAFLEKLGGRLDQIPVPKGTPAGDKAIQDAVNTSIEKLIDEYNSAVDEFDVNTRRQTVEKMSARIKEIRVKIEAYHHYLGERQKELMEKLKVANEHLVEKVKQIGGGKEAKYDWNKILDGKIYSLKKGEDFDIKPQSFAISAYIAAKKRGLKLLYKVNGDEVVVQAKKSE